MAIIYIAGLQRSGTTFLQSLLLQYNNVVALGEVNATINAIRNVDRKTPKWKLKVNRRKENYWNPKTYHILLDRIGKDSFWGPIENKVREAGNLQSALEVVYNNASEKYPDHIFIDSSKSIESLKKIMELNRFKDNVKVLFCIRDYRGWLYSTKKHRKRIDIPQRNNLTEIYKWYWANKKILDYLHENFNSQHCVVSYDKLIFSYEEVMKKIASYCGLNSVTDSGNEEKFHEILGSQSLKQNTNLKEIRYDATWFSHSGSCLEKPVSLFNKKAYLKYSI